MFWKSIEGDQSISLRIILTIWRVLHTGDGIMSAIDIFFTVKTIKGKAGETRVLLTLNGKYLGHTEQRAEDNTAPWFECTSIHRDVLGVPYHGHYIGFILVALKLFCNT